MLVEASYRSPPSHKPLIFLLFNRLGSDSPSNGPGLAFCRNLLSVFYAEVSASVWSKTLSNVDLSSSGTSIDAMRVTGALSDASKIRDEETTARQTKLKHAQRVARQLLVLACANWTVALLSLFVRLTHLLASGDMIKELVATAALLLSLFIGLGALVNIWLVETLG